MLTRGCDLAAKSNGFAQQRTDLCSVIRQYLDRGMARSAQASVACVVLGLAALAVFCDPPGATAQDLAPYEVDGFRGARFGMTEPEVRSVVIKNLGVKTSDLGTAPNPIEGTTVLTARVASLDPGPGPAQVAFIFGHTSKKLIQVNVIWGDDQNSKADASAMVAAGTRLERYFSGYSWRKDTTRAGIPVGDNTVVMFAGEDGKKGALRVVVDGVKYQVMQAGKETNSPEPKGPPRLVINYIADRENPDVAKIEKGKF